MGAVHTLPEDDKTSLDNYEFYTGKIKCKPDRVHIDEFHDKWVGDYFELEANHSYIQWLFPIREGGLNWSSQPLTKYESELFKNSKEIQDKIIKSYKLMLDFYGLELADEKTGEIKRAKNYKGRYRHLNSSFHNYLRITRILKCLGIVGLEYLKKPLILHFCNEVFKNDELYNTKRSLLHYWIPTLRIDKELKEVEDFVEKCGEEVDRDQYDDWDKETWANTRVKEEEKKEEKKE